MSPDTSWFSVVEVEPGIHRISEPHHIEEVSSWLIVGDDRAILLDTGMGVANIQIAVEAVTTLPVTVLNSHADWDHIGGNALFHDILIHPAEAHRLPLGYPNDRMRPWFGPESLTGSLPEGVTQDTLAIAPSEATGFVEDGDIIDLGTRRLCVLHIPGHSPGLIALLDETNGILFSTDAAYDGPLYASRGPDLVAYAESLQRLADLAPGLRTVYPSHNRVPIEPSLIAPMADALRRILDGAQPIATEAGRETYQIGDVVLYLSPNEPDSSETSMTNV